MLHIVHVMCSPILKLFFFISPLLLFFEGFRKCSSYLCGYHGIAQIIFIFELFQMLIFQDI